jgi:gamma-glutamylcyclotransferase (GGCT)/AIG2-like uncharacterized protein YtfP
MINKIIPLFVFGTLMNESTLLTLGVDPINKQEAILQGFRKSGLNIIQDESTEVKGHYFQINEQELHTLDFYESVNSKYGYHRFLVNVRVGELWKRAYVYQIKGT